MSYPYNNQPPAGQPPYNQPYGQPPNPQPPYPQQSYTQPYGQPMPAMQPMSAHGPRQPSSPEPRPSAGVLIGVSLWRLVIIACAFIGFLDAVSFSFEGAIVGLSQQASLLTGIVYIGLLLYPLFVGGRRHEPKTPWWRGAMSVLLILVSVTFLTIMGGTLQGTASLFEHGITPLVVVIDWIVVGRNTANARWWHPLTWCVFPLAYLAYFLVADVRLYGSFLDPTSSDFLRVVGGFLGALLVAGYLLYGIGKIRAAASSPPAQPTSPGPQPGYYPPR